MSLPRPALLCLLLTAFPGRSAPAADRPPNIVFVIADDLGYAELGCYGQEKIRTPHLDRMAAEGMRFTQHYAGNAVCAPSRCVLMTGRHAGHAHVRNNREMRNRVSSSETTPEIFGGQEPNPRIALYNLETDVGEEHDVFAEHPQIVAQIEEIMRREHVRSDVFPFPALDRVE